MGTYLQDHTPHRRQFRERYDKLSGLFVIHTAESPPDVVGPDTGADNVARFIAGRADPGSYHVLVDSDSSLQLVPYELAAYGDGTGSNEFAIHFSFATTAARWATLPEEWKDGALDQMARELAKAARWLKANRNITVPARRVSKRESDARMAGFISHAERDPGRRTDPGATFPWAVLLDRYAKLMNPPPTKPAPTPVPPVKGKPATEVTEVRGRLTKLIKKTKDAARRRKLRRARKELPSR